MGASLLFGRHMCAGVEVRRFYAHVERDHSRSPPGLSHRGRDVGIRGEGKNAVPAASSREFCGGTVCDGDLSHSAQLWRFDAERPLASSCRSVEITQLSEDALEHAHGVNRRARAHRLNETLHMRSVLARECFEVDASRAGSIVDLRYERAGRRRRTAPADDGLECVWHVERLKSKARPLRGERTLDAFACAQIAHRLPIE